MESNLLKQAELLCDKAYQNLQQISPANTRLKRGLINGVGTAINPLTSQLQFLVQLSLTECNSMKPVEFFHKNSYSTIFECALSESVKENVGKVWKIMEPSGKPHEWGVAKVSEP